MEHLVIVDRELFPLVKFPFVGEKWDGGSFDEYPARRGYDTTTQRFYAPGVGNSRDASYAFYQTWLYLGLLADGFMGLDRNADPNELFLRDDEETGGQVLTTENLVQFASDWRAAVDAMDVPAKVQAIIRANACVARVNRLIEELAVPNPMHLIWEKDITPLGEQVRFAVGLLCDALGHSILSTTGSELEAQIDKYNSKYSRDGEEVAYPVYTYHRWRIGNSLDAAMDRALLCPVEKTQLAEASPAFLCYLLSLPETNRSPGQHANCVNGTCVGNNIDEATYVTRHVDGDCDCDCEHDGPNIEDVKKCLRDNHIPSLSISIVDGEYRGMKVKPQKVEQASFWRFHQGKSGLARSLDYVALSHVWSDGLGNPFANTLPRCQLRRLAYYVNYTMKDGKARGIKGGFEKAFNISKHIFAKRVGEVWEQDGNFECCIWVDTMCVPLEKEYRKLAIKNMNQVYRQARYVMVLDASIARHDFRSDEELMARVVLSTWMRRVWTLQEAILGLEKLAICLKDRVVDHTDAVERLRVVVNSGERTAVNGMLEGVAVLGDDGFQGLNGAVDILEFTKGGPLKLSNIDSSRGDKQLQEKQYRIFMENLWTLIGRRATTKEEDRVLVACNILYKDATKVLKGDGHTGRLTGLLDQLDEVPAGAIFKSGERVPVDGYRWACHIFKLSAWGAFDFNNPGKVTPQGLLVRFPGFVLSEKAAGPEFGVMVHAGGERTLYAATCTYPRKTADYITAEDWSHIVTRNENNLAMIVSDAAPFMHTNPLKNGGVVECKQRRAVLVSISAEQGGCVYCRYEAFVWLGEYPSVDYEEQMVAEGKITVYDNRSSNQQWYKFY
ncbi:hypothetical protein Dda_4891 [Drechslerella dactyloides]|uniref:Heterokaryon incompatibility domain-containing protein n=1 Tax=Drechslerella dactyloides TaxID=74499 RepID=A0AAD6NJG5_DREDA|nr:hypothetical protein Dda_4891 [Drechslerella dactyloides]